MSLEPDLADQQLLADSFRRYEARMTLREGAVALTVAVGFALGCLALALAQPPAGFSLLAAGLAMVVLTASTQVRFDTPFGFTAPIQLGFVPLLFVVPAAIVPLAVAGALTIAALPELVRRELPAGRALNIPGNAWFALGPAAVFVIGGTDAWSASVPLLLGALCAQFLVDFTISTLRYAVGLRARFSSQLREMWVYGVDAGLTAPALVVAHATRQSPIAVLSLLPLLGLLSVFAHERHRRMHSLVELNEAYRGTALVLGDVVEADDGYTGMHCRSVVALSLEVAAKLGLDPHELRNLEFGALLHDVGKIAIPKEIINNPGKLTEDEWAIIKTHTVEGQRMLERVGGFMSEVGLIVRSHHERWDGGGYPDGLSGEEIPIESRIITCCDSWNAMRTDRVYRRALPRREALDELLTNSGSQFDPRVVKALTVTIAEGIGAEDPERDAPSYLGLEGARLEVV